MKPLLLVPALAFLSLAHLPACGDDEARVIDARSSSIDGGVIDAAPGGPDAAEYGVRCGPQQELCVPGTSQGCCDDPDGGVACEPAFGLCLGPLTSCDGPEDCDNPGDLCCDFGFGPGCSEPSNCATDNGGTVVCHGDGQCPDSAPSCCAGRCAATACP